MLTVYFNRCNMMYANDMVRVTLSMKKEEVEELKELAKRDQRPISRQVVFMMQKYKQYHPDK